MSKPEKPSAVYIDANRNPIGDTDWGLRAETAITLASATLGTNTIFTVTGTVLIRIIAICETTLTGASATLELGISGNTAKLIAQTTGTDIDAGEIWHDATPDSGIELSSVAVENILTNGSDVILTIGTAAVTAGKIRFIACWYPLSADGKVEGIKGGVYAAQVSSLSPQDED